ncbi:MAG: isoaspartyl peptidase/L-asparaginase family protein [Bacillota bacterium]
MSIIIVHGGVEAGTTPGHIMELERAALTGAKLLSRGLLDAAEGAVRILEDSPLFNAGYGSVLNLDGEVEMDASVMDGATGKIGAVAAVKDVAHPVSAARMLLEDGRHAILAGDGAASFAFSRGIQRRNCISPEMLAAWQRAVGPEGQTTIQNTSLFTALPFEGAPFSETVGCVVSAKGFTAAASSTGGSFLKLPGRIGDTPIPGAGIFASQRCAVVCSGLGEAFIETLAAAFAGSMVAAGMHPREAAEKTIARLTSEKGAAGGIVVVDSLNRFGAAHNTRSFPVRVVLDGRILQDFVPQKLPPPIH